MLLKVGPFNQCVHQLFTGAAMGISIVEHADDDVAFTGDGVYVSGDGRDMVNCAGLDVRVTGADSFTQAVLRGAVHTHY